MDRVYRPPPHKAASHQECAGQEGILTDSPSFIGLSPREVATVMALVEARQNYEFRLGDSPSALRHAVRQTTTVGIAANVLVLFFSTEQEQGAALGELIINHPGIEVTKISDHSNWRQRLDDAKKTVFDSRDGVRPTRQRVEELLKHVRRPWMAGDNAVLAIGENGRQEVVLIGAGRQGYACELAATMVNCADLVLEGLCD
ncbi:MAG: hypothetical protein F8N15_01420 [Methanobacterium sp.]|nr:hypothetical protein [Methanobacterium sp.]